MIGFLGMQVLDFPRSSCIALAREEVHSCVASAGSFSRVFCFYLMCCGRDGGGEKSQWSVPFSGEIVFVCFLMLVGVVANNLMISQTIHVVTTVDEAKAALAKRSRM